MILALMKAVTRWGNTGALVLIWGYLSFAYFTGTGPSAPPLWGVVAVGVVASLLFLLLFTVLVRIAAYLAITVRAYLRGGRSFSSNSRSMLKWIAIGCAYGIFALAIAFILGLPESITGTLVITGCFALFLAAVLLFMSLADVLQVVVANVNAYKEVCETCPKAVPKVNPAKGSPP